LLDSYPSIYKNPKGARIAGHAGVITALSTGSVISDALKDLRSSTMPFIDIDEREAVSNDLGDIVDVYQTGWLSGSDEDDD
jgi:hypothetical protein